MGWKIADKGIEDGRDFRLLLGSEDLDLGAESVLAGVLRHLPLAFRSLGTECQRRRRHLGSPVHFALHSGLPQILHFAEEAVGFVKALIGGRYDAGEFALRVVVAAIDVK